MNDLDKKLYVYNEEDWKRACKKNYLNIKKPSIEILNEGIILPIKKSSLKKGLFLGGVCDKFFNFKAGLIRNSENNPGYFGVSQSYPVEFTKLKKSKFERIIFGGVLIGHFGHFILECMSRLWNIENDDTKIAFLDIPTFKRPDWFYDFLYLLNIKKDRVIFIDEPTKFKTIIIPEESVRSWNYYTQEYSKIYKKILSKINPSPIKKVYLTRTKLSNSQYSNEKFFEDFYSKLGYSIISPEKLSIYDQLSIMKGANQVVCMLGTLSHFALFCNENTKFTMLCRTNNDVLIPQCIINQSTKIDWKIVDVSQNILYAHRSIGPYLLGNTLYFSKYVQDEFNISINNDTIKDNIYDYMKSWTNFYISHKDYLNFYFPDFDVNIVQNLFYHFLNITDKTIISNNTSKKLNNLNKKYTIMQLYNNLFKKIIEIKYKRPFLYYETHHTNIGWGGVNIEHFNNFDENNKYEIQAIKINFSNKFYDIIYSVYTIEDGWFTEVRTGQLSGTIGKNRFIRGIYINFLESPNNLFNITYRCYSNNSWSDWFKNGDKIICDYPITLLQIKLDNNMCLFT